MSLQVKTDSFSLPLTFLGGEQEKVTIPFDDFSLADDKDFLKQVDDDERDEKIVYAYSDSGISENGRNWTPEIMESMSTQVIEKMPVGYLGHIKPSEYGYEFPEPQIVWFGSTTEVVDTDTTRLWIKGYLLPTADKLETWIKSKAVDSISVYGKISYTMKGDVMDIQAIDLKSIDVSRKLGEGLNSGIVGLHGEMEVTYEDVREKIQNAMREYIKKNPTKFGYEKPVNKTGDKYFEPYVYSWIRKMYVDEKKCIINCEYCNKYKNFEIEYEIDESEETVTITSFVEVVEKITYEKKAKGVENNDANIVSEMKKSKEEGNVMPTEIKMSDVMADQALYAELKKAFATEMANENSQQVLVTKAGEMDQIIALIGGEQTDIVGNIKKIVSFNAKFVGEMSTIFGGEQDEALAPEVIVEKAKETVETVEAVKEAVGATEGKDVVEAVKDAVATAGAVEATSAIAEVNKAFDDKIATIKDEALAEFVRDDFADIVGLDAKDIEGDVGEWKTGSLAEIEEKFDAVVKKYEARLAKIQKNAKAVGEMNAFGDLGGNTHNSGVAGHDDEDPDIAEARRLGYI